MDVFWLIPMVLVGIALLSVLYARIRKLPSSMSTPHVLVDKPLDKPAIDQATLDHDWSGRPCGSFLDYLAGRD